VTGRRSSGSLLLLCSLFGLAAAVGAPGPRVAAQAAPAQVPGAEAQKRPRSERAPDRDRPDVPMFNLGQPAPRALIEAWDTDVMPDGTGLPAGTGTARLGAPIYAMRCAACHGAKGEGAGFDRLVSDASRAEFAFARDRTLPRTVGNYWPYATTLFDYIRRAMPQLAPSTLTADETYSLTAYVLYLNGLLPEDAELNAQTLAAVVMPARDRFVRDNRRGGREIR
jgi:S-disulfanyl-L-cysteine oxidoreductase SoxD